jgi:hypothetical protein
MRPAFILESFRDEYIKLLKNTLFIYLDSHWFISREEDSTEIYVIRIKDQHEDLEYTIQRFASNFEVVTDNENVSKLLSFVHQIFDTIESAKLDNYNESGQSDIDLFSQWTSAENIELDNDGTFKIKIDE